MLKVQAKNILKRGQTASFALLFNTFSWYFIGRLIIHKVENGFTDSYLINLLELTFPSAIIASGVIGSIFLVKSRRIRFFCVWTIFGIFASLFLVNPLASSFPVALAATGVLGASIGLGMPMCLNHFALSISNDNRGKTGGMILFGTILASPFASLAISSFDLTSSAVLLAVWRASCLPFLFLITVKDTPNQPNVKAPSLFSVFRNRVFYLYFSAWLMFAFVDSFEGIVVAPKIETLIGDFGFPVRALEPTVAGFSALIGGLLSDRIGRKKVLMFGFVSLGIAYATIGLLSQLLISWLFYLVIDGIAIGLLWSLLVIVLWGDLSDFGSERFYAIGETPFFLAQILSVVLTPYVTLISEGSSFSLAAFFLFLAVLPLLYAPETLPEKKLKDRELKGYINKAKEKVRKSYS